MTLNIIKKEMVEPAVLQCWIGARYWEDSSFNGVDDDDTGRLLREKLPGSFFIHHNTKGDYPVRHDMDTYKQDYLFIQIDLKEGKVIDWPNDVYAGFSYKSCDMNYFRLLDDKGNILCQTREGDSEYVIGPSFTNDSGDYFVLGVNKDGTIDSWGSSAMEHSLQDWIDEKNEEDE